ncbi:MAG TPA: bifunctional folylpolyglutamate synthase/dihydrofolate synthase [Clostridiales bacterium]|jgi:dihydrofolate synthase/folylpolyglutamate synthase|nr:bifunctional folylpolyglutamate synthase/dihydrofolate synthase [Clostridiales bacterium]
MNYDEALDYIHGTYKFGSKLGLENIKDLLARLGNPQKQYRVIHVAGTNGKGSVTSMITNILHEAGYKVGMFISPYLENFTERIQVELREIPREDLAKTTQQVKEKVDEMVASGRNHPTEFEIVTAIGFLYFARQKIDIAVVEVGLGGRFDATNVVDEPLLSVITAIGFDHMDILGSTLGEIAFEKAGIIKQGRPVVSYPQLGEASSVIREAARERKSPYYEVDGHQIDVKESSLDENVFDFRYGDELYRDLKLKLVGEHQLLNAATALTAIEVVKELGLTVSKEAVVQGLLKTRWPGRLEKIQDNPIILIDGAHNAAGADALAHTVSTYFANDDLTLVLGVLKDKEVDAIVNRLCPLAHKVIITRPDSPRAMDPAELSEKVLVYNNNVTVEPDIIRAIHKGIDAAGEQGVILICGSLYLVGAARKYIKTMQSRE